MSVHDELHDLAESLEGTGWRHKFEEEWTPAERTAYRSSTKEELWAWLEWMLDESIQIEVVKEWTEEDRVHRLERLSHNGNLLSEHDAVSVINYSDRPEGLMGHGPERDESLRRCPEIATPAERRRLGLKLPPRLDGSETPDGEHLDPWRDRP